MHQHQPSSGSEFFEASRRRGIPRSRQRARARGIQRLLSPCLLTLLLFAPDDSAIARAAETGPMARRVPPAESWTRALADYARDPTNNRRALKELRRYDPADLPAPAVLALADARLRSGNTGAAERLFALVRERDAGEPWATYAELGLGGIAFRRGDDELARTHYERAAASGPAGGAAARMMLAFLEASSGDPRSRGSRGGKRLGGSDKGCSVNFRRVIPTTDPGPSRRGCRPRSRAGRRRARDGSRAAMGDG